MADSSSKWLCPSCRSDGVLVSIPAWFIETANGGRAYIGNERNNEPVGWYCEHCCRNGEGAPDLNAP